MHIPAFTLPLSVSIINHHCVADGSGGDVYYEACRDITHGTELLVWYGDRYVQFMGIPVGMVDYRSSRQISLSLPSFAECNGVDEHRQVDASDNSETNSEGFIGLLRNRRHRRGYKWTSG